MTVGSAKSSLPGLCKTAGDGSIVRDAQRDGLYCVSALKDGNWKLALDYMEIGADPSTKEAVSPRRCIPLIVTDMLLSGQLDAATGVKMLTVLLRDPQLVTVVDDDGRSLAKEADKCRCPRIRELVTSKLQVLSREELITEKLDVHKGLVAHQPANLPSQVVHDVVESVVNREAVPTGCSQEAEQDHARDTISTPDSGKLSSPDSSSFSPEGKTIDGPVLFSVRTPPPRRGGWPTVVVTLSFIILSATMLVSCMPHGHNDDVTLDGAEPPADASLSRHSGDSSVIAVAHVESSDAGISAAAVEIGEEPVKAVVASAEEVTPSVEPTRRPFVIRLDENDNVIFIGEPGSEEDPMREWELANNKNANGVQVAASLVGTAASQKAGGEQATPTAIPSVIVPLVEEPPAEYNQEDEDVDPELAAAVDIPEEPVNLEPAMAAFLAVATAVVGCIAVFL